MSFPQLLRFIHRSLITVFISYYKMEQTSRYQCSTRPSFSLKMAALWMFFGTLNNNNNIHGFVVPSSVHRQRRQSTAISGMKPTGRADVDVVFGSQQVRSDGDKATDWGLDEEDLDEDQLDRMKRNQVVQDLLQKQDEEFRKERKQRTWGKFANVTKKEDLDPLLEEERKKVEKGASIIIYLFICVLDVCCQCRFFFRRLII